MTAETETARRVTLGEVMASVQANWWHVLWLGVSLAVVAAALLAHEWFVIGFVRDPGEIANYHFGSEAMLAHGGWHYASAQAYATTAALEGLVATGVAVLLVVSIRRKSFYWLIAAGALILANYVTLFAIGQLFFAR